MEISDFQNRIRKTYFEKDLKRGKEKTFMWFIEEVGELAEELRNSDKRNEKIESEFGDVFAWLCSLANLYDIDIEKCIRKYKNGCPKCGKEKCECKE